MNGNGCRWKGCRLGVTGSRRSENAGLSAEVLGYWSQVYGFARAICGDAVGAEDLCQEAYLRLHERRESIDFGRPVLPLLLTIVRRLAISERRRRRPLTGGAVEEDGAAVWEPLAPEESDPARRAEVVDDCRQLGEALARLAPKWRAALFLRDGLALSYAEIADVIEASVDSVRTTLHRARQRLRELLSERSRRP